MEMENCNVAPLCLLPRLERNHACGTEHDCLWPLVEDWIKSVVLTLLHPDYSELVEDAIQEAKLRVFFKHDQFSGKGRFQAWVSIIASNEAKGRIRKAISEQRKVDKAAKEAQTITSEDEHAKVNTLDRLEALKRCIDELPPKFKTLVMLNVIHGASIEEIADELGIPKGTVYDRRANAFRKLRLCVERTGLP